jgi:hypothetical protein
MSNELDLEFDDRHFLLESVNQMIIAKSALEQIHINNRTSDYNSILNSIETFLKNNCQHCLVGDYIDIDPDRSEYITYCSICLTTMN